MKKVLTIAALFSLLGGCAVYVPRHQAVVVRPGVVAVRPYAPPVVVARPYRRPYYYGPYY
ncbi:hypothetical protein [Paralcaligenes ureilyticus]|uniref:hypothetical protein n=1 Tax=Paralcaligenes ureilyticus TaxID=627131 RepID=UPI0010448654|nr:hypothetical protein [Paralcaligenes ureilyticus]